MVKVRKKGALRRLIMTLLKLLGLFAVLLLAFFTLTYALVDIPDVTGFTVSPEVSFKDDKIFYVALNDAGERLLPTKLEDMGVFLPLLSVNIEDKRFYRHWGVDPLAILRATWQNLSARRVVSGASTITAQLVRIAEPRKRNLYSKYLEFVKAIKLERKYSKDKILELYLNRAPFGNNIRGVGAAARTYFNKEPKDLSLGEAALLVSLLRGPTLYSPFNNPELARKRRDFNLDLLYSRKVISYEDMLAAKSEPITTQRECP